ncbi:RecQ family ATP-dependent DNA helicase [Frigoribacterium sp. 2-23]|uniref:RecQ family ATP-dependent DNA helicase n=1 Tax=Frigoribacterium sp. 2-23 TaxID=3415006 RepID=UPI003C700109
MSTTRTRTTRTTDHAESTDRDRTDRIVRAAADLFGWDDLHAAQLEAIEAVVAGRDTLGIMPTGFGKSAIYQVAGAVLDGPTVVVSPLIALQADQVAGLVGRPDAPAAIAVNSGHTDAENDEGWQRLADGEITYVFLAPEQLARDETVDRLRDAGVALLVVDEAHCVSTWGHDFRPDYLHLGEVVERLGRPTVLALTATGSGPVRDEIVERLRLDDPLVLSRGFDRPNLALEVVRHEDDAEKIRAVVEQVAAATTPGIVYVATRKATERYAADIAERSPELTVVGYHGGQRSAERGELHERFHAGEVDVVVATSAFGMGIDKPDIRFVVHADVPDSLDGYYQEIGRAGRDGEEARATLHYRPEDLGLRSFFASGLPGRADLRGVFTALSAAGRPVSRTEVADQLALGSRSVSRLLDLLHEAGAVRDADDGLEPVEGFDAHDAAEAAREIAQTRDRVEKSRIEMMRTYAEAPGCRRHFLLGYFGEDSPEHCGNCDGCTAAERDEEARGEDHVDATDTEPPAFATDSRVRHDTWGEGVVMGTEEGRVTVFFESEGYKILDVASVQEHGLLTPVSPA